MTEQYDIVVAGAGHNALVAAAYLAKAGMRCLVLEAREQIGGDTATEELTLPGFLHDTCSTAHNLIQASPTLRDNELHLGEYGLEYLQPDPVVHVPFPDGASITQWRDLDRTCEEFGRFSERDAAAYRRLIADYDAVKGAFGSFRYTPIDWGPSLDALLSDLPAGKQWMRRRQLSASQVIFDLFEDDHVRAFMLWMAFMTLQPVDRPGTGWLAYALVFGRQKHSWTIPRGGSAALPQALGMLVEAHGGTILTDQQVTSLIVEGRRCVGVETASGGRFRANRAVLSTIHVKHLIEMAPRDQWDDDFIYGVETWQPGMTIFAAHYATTDPPLFESDGHTVKAMAAGLPSSVDRMLALAPDFGQGIVSVDDPVLLVLCPTVADPSRAPEGRHTVKIMGFQPYDLPEGPSHWDAIKEEVAASNLAQLRRFAPNLTEDKILAQHIKSPLDLERVNAHNWHGSCHGGDMGPAQTGALRPAPGWAQHRMPIAGLYQTGATTHPGGSVSAAPGRNAARVMLSDLGISFDEVIGGG
ncbi:MAG TPA: NAD(P)/FAD-dependent oxidoreductase [Acidimicrobiia bacterium]